MSINEEPHILENIFVRVVITLVYSFIFLLCFLGNLTVIVVVTLQRKRRSVSKFCLWNMAVANFSLSLFCILQNLTLYLLGTWIFGELMCKWYQLVISLFHTASILIAVLISIERYVVVLHSLRCKQILTTRKLLLMILAVWLISAGISFPRFFFFGLIPIQLNEYGDFGYICVPIKSMYNSATADTIYFLLLYLVPVGVMSVLYFRIGLFLKQRLWKNLVGENAEVHISASTPSQLQGVQKNPRGLGIRSMREAHSAPEGLTSLSDSTSSSANFTIRAPALPQPRNPRSQSMRSPWISEDGYPTAVRQVARPYRIQQIRRATDRLSGYTVRSIGATSSSSAQQSTKSININNNINASRVLYRYNRLELSRHRCKQRQRVVRTFMFIVLSFAVLNLPYHARKLCLHYSLSFDVTSEASNLIDSFTFALMYANCAVNPILYAFMSKNFRASLRELCSKSRRYLNV